MKGGNGVGAGDVETLVLGLRMTKDRRKGLMGRTEQVSVHGSSRNNVSGRGRRKVVRKGDGIKTIV